jgi:hypothetical protein
MSGGRHIAWHVVAVFACIALQGCYTYKTVAVKVVDAESGEPVPGANVWVGFENIGITYTPLFFLAPSKEHSAVTGPDGLASLRVHNGYPPWSITAPGYIAFRKHVEDGRVPKEYSRARVGKRRVYVAKLYGEPRPEVWIVVPDNYSGPIRMRRTVVRRDVVTATGQRVFEFNASAEGDVFIETPPVLGPTVFSVFDDLRFRYASGQEIPRWPFMGRGRLRAASPTTVPRVGWDYVYGVGPERELFVVGDSETAMKVMSPFRTERRGYFLEPKRFEIAWSRR